MQQEGTAGAMRQGQGCMKHQARGHEAGGIMWSKQAVGRRQSVQMDQRERPIQTSGDLKYFQG